MKAKFFALTTLSMVLAGCATSVPKLLPGADNITVSEQAAPSSCNKLTDLTAQQSNKYASAQDLERGAMNQIRNAALQQNANYLYLTANYAHTSKNSLHSDAVDSVTIKGVAYYCANTSSTQPVVMSKKVTKRTAPAVAISINRDPD